MQGLGERRLAVGVCWPLEVKKECLVIGIRRTKGRRAHPTSDVNIDCNTFPFIFTYI